MLVAFSTSNCCFFMCLYNALALELNAETYHLSRKQYLVVRFPFIGAGWISYSILLAMLRELGIGGYVIKHVKFAAINSAH